ncbi:SUF system NifU family Fe-S cluster assembly protein [Candidatus Woesearchaeota archaeon]|nr:SUF system NifU family Fe-S cluster assembly protein [Candidatus Woesearchaeota archaeon]
MTEIIDRNYAGEGIYRENIIDHYTHPRNFGKLEKFDVQHREFNPLCGDETTIEIKVENNIIKDIKFHGKGCAISMAAASMLLSELKGKPIENIKNISKEHVFDLLSISISPVRVKCALLCLETVRTAVKIYEGGIVEKVDKKVYM